VLFYRCRVYFYDMKKLEASKLIGERLARYRKAKGLTQVELAGKLGVSQSLLALYESGRRNIPVAVLLASARLLDVSVSELVGETASAPRKPGPQSVLEKQVQEIQRLPRTDQQFVSKFLHRVLSSAGA